MLLHSLAAALVESAGLATNSPHRGFAVAELSFEDINEVFDLRAVCLSPGSRRA